MERRQQGEKLPAAALDTREDVLLPGLSIRKSNVLTDVCTIRPKSSTAYLNQTRSGFLTYPGDDAVEWPGLV
jgi:hypothetical protein